MGRHVGDHVAGRMFGKLDDGPPKQRRDPVQVAVRTASELLITAGLVVLLFVFYEVYITDLLSDGKQRQATAALDDSWNKNHDTVDGGERTNKYDVADGKGFAKLYLPSLGPDVHFTILEGTDDNTLLSGPGHYKGTAMPGQPGNFAVAGHRVGMGSPFNDLDLLNSCDAIVVETQTSWFVYRMLPKKEEVAKWPAKQTGNPRCADVKPLPSPYNKVVGQEIVLPSDGGVISPVPNQPTAPPEPSQQKLLTLTTCHPKFSPDQRMIIHAVLTRQAPKDPANPNQIPPELTENN